MADGLDLGPVLDTAGAVLGQALATVGTRVLLLRPVGTGVVDPETTALVEVDPEILARDVPALVLADAPGGEERIYPGAREAQDPRWRIVLGPDVVDVRRGDVVVVTASRDGRLVGGRWNVSTVLDNAAGVARTLLATRQPDRGQT